MHINADRYAVYDIVNENVETLKSEEVPIYDLANDR